MAKYHCLATWAEKCEKSKKSQEILLFPPILQLGQLARQNSEQASRTCLDLDWTQSTNWPINQNFIPFISIDILFYIYWYSIHPSDLLQICIAVNTFTPDYYKGLYTVAKIKTNIKSDQLFDQEGEFISFSKHFSVRLLAAHNCELLTFSRRPTGCQWWAIDRAMSALCGQWSGTVCVEHLAIGNVHDVLYNRAISI